MCVVVYTISHDPIIITRFTFPFYLIIQNNTEYSDSTAPMALGEQAPLIYFKGIIIPVIKK